MRPFLIFAFLTAGALAAAFSLYWFFEATTLPVADAAQQAVQVLYNIHAALWALIGLTGFGFAGLLANAVADPAAVRVSSPQPAPAPLPLPEPRERPTGSRGQRERVEPRL